MISDKTYTQRLQQLGWVCITLSKFKLKQALWNACTPGGSALDCDSSSKSSLGDREPTLVPGIHLRWHVSISSINMHKRHSVFSSGRVIHFMQCHSILHPVLELRSNIIPGWLLSWAAECMSKWALGWACTGRRHRSLSSSSVMTHSSTICEGPFQNCRTHSHDNEMV